MRLEYQPSPGQVQTLLTRRTTNLFLKLNWLTENCELFCRDAREDMGSVIEPYRRYPKLLGIMLARLQAEQVLQCIYWLFLESQFPHKIVNLLFIFAN